MMGSLYRYLVFFLFSSALIFPQNTGSSKDALGLKGALIKDDSLTKAAKNDLSLESKQIKNCFNWADEQLMSSQPIGVAVAEIGKYFLDTGYEAATLESGNEENLIVYLSGFDCTTLVENVLALARLVKKEDNTFEAFQKELTLIRYRDGVIDEYPSRLHYFSDWIYDNVKKGLIKDITDSLGGEHIKFDLNFMSTHPDAYKHLKANPKFVPQIASQEKEISKRSYSYIPANKVGEVESKIKDGDIIAFTTSIKGLDISHVTIAVKQSDKRIHLLHAPVVGSKVQITEAPLPDYIKKVKKHSGIIILRPVEPKS